MLEGTAALARFRQSPKPEWNARALAAFQRAMALADPNSATEWQAWTDAAVSAASVLHDLARYAEAEPLLRDCLRLREANSGPNSPAVGAVLNNLALLLQCHEPSGGGRAALSPRAGDRRAVVRPGPPRRRHPTSTTWRCCSRPRTVWRRPSRSIAAPGDRRAVVRPGPPRRRVATSTTWRLLLKATNRLAEAEPLYRRALAIDERSYGPDHPDVAIRLNNLAELLQATNRLAEAEPLDRRALAIDERSYGPDHPDVAIDLNNLARCSRPRTVWRRPSRSIAARWRSPSGRTARTTPTSLATSTTWRSCSRPRTVWRRPSRSIAARWRSTSGRTARTTPTSRSRLNNLAYVAPGHEPSGGGRAADGPRRSRLLAIPASDRPRTPAPASRDEQLPPICSPMLKLSEPEIAARIKAASEGTDKLSPIVPEVERLLGPAQPVADVLTALDRQYKEQGKPAIYSLKPNEPIAPHLDELLRPNGEGLNSPGSPRLPQGDSCRRGRALRSRPAVHGRPARTGPGEAQDPHESCRGLARAGPAPGGA